MADKHNNIPENNGGAKPRGFSSKKNIIFIILVAILTFGIGSAVIVAGVSNTSESRLSRHMRAAERYLSEMNYERAVIEYQRVLEIDPMNVDAILGLADAYIGMGDTEKSIEILRDGLERTGDERIRARLDELTKVEEKPPVSSEPEGASNEKVVFSVQNKEGKPLKDVQITVETSYDNDGNKWEQKEKWITDEKGEMTGYLPDGEYIITYTYGGQKKSENTTIKDRGRELSIILSDEDNCGDNPDVSEEAEGMEVASGICGDDLNWKINDKGVLTIFGSGDMYDYSPKKEDNNFAPWYNSSLSKIVIEEGVTSIGNAAFYKGGVDVDIPEGVTRIGEYAFASASIQNMILPNSVEKIGKSAFANTPIKTVEIPEKVHEIEDSTFSNCNKLTTVQMHDGIEKIGKSAFKYCSKLEHISIPDSVKEIGAYAFQVSGLVGIDLPKQLKVVSTYIFSGCESLEYIELPNSVVYIDDGAFLFCKKLKEIHILNPDCKISTVAGFETSTTFYAPTGGERSQSIFHKSIEQYVKTFGNPIVSLDSFEALD